LRAQKKTLGRVPKSNQRPGKPKITRVKSANRKIQDTHDYNEAETREYLIDILLREAGWNPKGENVEEYPVVGMPNKPGRGFVDYVWGDDGRALGLGGGKTDICWNPRKGKQQANFIADLPRKNARGKPDHLLQQRVTKLGSGTTKITRGKVQGFYTKIGVGTAHPKPKSANLLKDLPTISIAT